MQGVILLLILVGYYYLSILILLLLGICHMCTTYIQSTAESRQIEIHRPTSNSSILYVVCLDYSYWTANMPYCHHHQLIDYEILLLAPCSTGGLQFRIRVSCHLLKPMPWKDKIRRYCLCAALDAVWPNSCLSTLLCL